MSFSWNAYTHLELAETDEGEWTWICESCGENGTGGRHAVLVDPDQPGALRTLADAFYAHIYHSHKRTAEDFIDWPNGL